MAQKHITNNALKNTFAKFTSILKSWLPIKFVDVDNDGTPDKVVIQTPSYKNVMEIDIDGNIMIIGTDRDPIKLQERLDKIGTIVVETFDDATPYLTESNIGRLIYIKNAGENMVEGLYTIAIDASNHGSILLFKIGTTTGSTEDLGTRVDALEYFVKNPLTETEISDITNK